MAYIGQLVHTPISKLVYHFPGRIHPEKAAYEILSFL